MKMTQIGSIFLHLTRSLVKHRGQIRINLRSILTPIPGWCFEELYDQDSGSLENKMAAHIGVVKNLMQMNNKNSVLYIIKGCFIISCRA
jgi:hypothetical protein